MLADTPSISDEADRMLTEAAIAALAARLRGDLLRPGDADHDRARSVWNTMIDRRPALIARCRGAADVMAAVDFARESGLLLAVRGGGHNVAGTSVCDGGLMIDLSPMKGVWVDAAARTARAEPGVTWAEFDAETQAFGLATTGGVVTSTGLSGLTLGGGLGWLAGKHGLACDNLISADVVTADGERVTASATQNADLFWGLQGGGGNFGVVTSLEYRLHPVGQVYGGMLLYPLDRAVEVFRLYDTCTQGAPDDLTSSFAFVTGPDGAKVCAVVVCHADGRAGPPAALQPLRGASPLLDGLGPMAYGEVQNIFTPGFPAGLRNYWKSGFLDRLTDAAIATLAEGFRQVPTLGSGVLIEQIGGAARRVGPAETAFPHRTARFNLLIAGQWGDAASDASNVGWVRGLWEAMSPYTSGSVYVNYLAEAADEGSGRIKAAYGAETYARLVALKRKYDPSNLFRVNQNIAPGP